MLLWRLVTKQPGHGAPSGASFALLSGRGSGFPENSPDRPEDTWLGLPMASPAPWSHLLCILSPLVRGQLSSPGTVDPQPLLHRVARGDPSACLLNLSLEGVCKVLAPCWALGPWGCEGDTWPGRAVNKNPHQEVMTARGASHCTVGGRGSLGRREQPLSCPGPRCPSLPWPRGALAGTQGQRGSSGVRGCSGQEGPRGEGPTCPKIGLTGSPGHERLLESGPQGPRAAGSAKTQPPPLPLVLCPQQLQRHRAVSPQPATDMVRLLPAPGRAPGGLGSAWGREDGGQASAHTGIRLGP